MSKISIYSTFLTKEYMDLIVDNFKEANGRIPDKHELDEEVELAQEFEYASLAQQLGYYFDGVHADSVFLLKGSEDKLNNNVRENKKGGKLFYGADEIYCLLDEYENYEISEVCDEKEGENIFTIEGFNIDLDSGEVLNMNFVVRRLTEKGVRFLQSNLKMDREKLHKELMKDKYSRNLEFTMECEGCDAM